MVHTFYNNDIPYITKTLNKVKQGEKSLQRKWCTVGEVFDGVTGGGKYRFVRF